MMNFGEVEVEVVKETVQEMLGEGFIVKSGDVYKVNDQHYHAISIVDLECQQKTAISPSYNLETYGDMAPEDIAAAVVKDYHTRMGKATSIAEKARDILCVRGNFAKALRPVMVNTSKNMNRLRDTVHRQEGEFTIYLELLIGDNLDGQGSVATAAVKPQHLLEVELDEAEAFRLAYQNARQEISIKSMASVIMGLIGDDEEMPGLDEFPMAVVTNRSGNRGAAYLTDLESLKMASERFGGSDLYLLPSSVHELIAIPTDMGMSPAELKTMVGEVNGTVLEPQDYLSDNVYIYRRAEDTLSVYED